MEYFDNKIICDLVEEKHKGIIAILDEECLRPGDVSDETFLTKLIQSVGQNKHFITHEMLDYEARKRIERNQFRLLHYAGEVTYTSVGFVDKNNDLLYRSLKEAANTSADPTLREMFPESELLSQKRPPTVSCPLYCIVSLWPFWLFKFNSLSVHFRQVLSSKTV